MFGANTLSTQSKQQVKRCTIPYICDNRLYISLHSEAQKAMLAHIEKKKTIESPLIIFQIFKCTSSCPSRPLYQFTLEKQYVQRMDGRNLSYLHGPTPLRNVNFSTAFASNLPIPCSIFNSKKNNKKSKPKRLGYLQDYHSVYTLNIDLSLNSK